MDAAHSFLQHWFNLSDPTVEEVLYDSRAMRRFVDIDLGREPVPDETTVCNFRHLLEKKNLGHQLLGVYIFQEKNVNTFLMRKQPNRAELEALLDLPQHHDHVAIEAGTF